MNKSWNPSVARLICLSLTLSWLAASVGCSPLDTNSGTGWFAKAEAKPSIPDNVVVSWKETVLRQAGRPALRGFGGRLMFHDNETKKPVRVEGNLVIYAFDEEDRDRSNTKPDRKYVFTPEQLAKHYSKSDLIGHSYSIWVPWDTVGGDQKTISLIARFTPDGGPMVVSEQASAVLPGKLPEAYAAKTQNQTAESGPVRTVNYNTTVHHDATVSRSPEKTAPTQRMKSHTITLPSRFGYPTSTVERRSPTRREPITRRTIPAIPAPTSTRIPAIPAPGARPTATNPTAAAPWSPSTARFAAAPVSEFPAGAQASKFPARTPPPTRFSPDGYQAPDGLVARPTIGRTW